jgi:hypothetical protein
MEVAMMEGVAVFRSASSAQLAVDLDAARVPSTSVRQFVHDPAAPEGLLEVRGGTATSGDSIVAVTVDARHAGLVMDIVGMQAPVSMKEEPFAAAA